MHLFVNVCRHALDSSIPPWVFLAQASSRVELQLLNIAWNLAIRTPLRGPSTVRPHSNCYKNSQQAQPFPMIMNVNVLHVSVHLSGLLWWHIRPEKCVVWHYCLSVAGCVGSLRCWVKRGLGCHTLSHMSSWARRWRLELGQKCRCSIGGAGTGDWG